MSAVSIAQELPLTLSVADELRFTPARIERLAKPRYARLAAQPRAALLAIVAAGEWAPIDSPAELDARVARVLLAVRQ